MATAPTIGPALEQFGVLGGQTVTNTGLTTVSCEVGVSPGSAITGFPPGTAESFHAADVLAGQAQLDLTAAYNDAAGQPCNTDLTGQDLGGMILTPGVYCFDTSAQLTGNLTLNGNGVYIFQIGSTLTTDSGSTVTLINGAQPGNVFWQVGSSATLGTTTQFVGNIFALTSITATTGATVNGRLLARNGSVTLDSNIITCPLAPTPIPSIRRKRKRGAFAFPPSFCERRMCYDEYNRQVPCDGTNRNFIPCPQEIRYPSQQGMIYVKYSEDDRQCCYRLIPISNNNYR